MNPSAFFVRNILNMTARAQYFGEEVICMTDTFRRNKKRSSLISNSAKKTSN